MDISMPSDFPLTDFRAFGLAARKFFPQLLSDEDLNDPRDRLHIFNGHGRLYATATGSASIPAKNSTLCLMTYILDKGLDHAWQWFTAHATQRMQAVNFFLVATAFLSTAYVAALRFPAVAVGVSALGALFSLVFYRFEIRIQELLKAGEKALYPAQQRLADLTGMQEFKICETVEKASRPFTKYSTVIRTLYGSTAAGFLMGLTYAMGHFSNEDELPPIIAYRIFVVLAAVAALYLGQKIVARDRATLNWLQCVIAFALVSAGIVVLIMSALRLRWSSQMKKFFGFRETRLMRLI